MQVLERVFLACYCGIYVAYSLTSVRSLIKCPLLDTSSLITLYDTGLLPIPWRSLPLPFYLLYVLS